MSLWDLDYKCLSLLFFCCWDGRKEEKIWIPDDKVVSLLRSLIVDDLSDWIQGGPCINDPMGGWSHWSNSLDSFSCERDFFIWESESVVLVGWGMENDVREFSVFNFDEPFPRKCRGKFVATAFGGGWL